MATTASSVERYQHTSTDLASSSVSFTHVGHDSGTAGELAFDVPTLPEGVLAAAVDELFRLDPALTAVVVGPPAAPVLVERGWFEHVMAGRLGYGRVLFARHEVAELAQGPSTVLHHEASVGAAASAVLTAAAGGRPRAATLVRRDDGSLAAVATVRLFEVLAQHFAQQAFTDALTGLPNRIALRHRLATRAEEATVLYVDLDRFKAVNDRYGHAGGDQVLVEFARRVRACVQPADLVVRLGGDEFAVVVDAPLSASGCRVLADRLVLEASAPFLVVGVEDGVEHLVSIGASVGVARATGGEETSTDSLEVLLRQADEAMYRAKTEGRGRTRLFDAVLDERSDGAPQATAVRAGGLPSDAGLAVLLRQAVADEAIEVHYQPVVDLVSGAVVGAEALARWALPGHGFVPPDKFIPLAERTGLVVEIGRQVLERSCRAAATWDGPSVAVNVSALQLADAGFADHVTQALAASGLPPDRLCLEITETAAIDDLDQAITRLTRLRAIGVRTALDDFGTGYSSLTLLRRLPLDIVKVDRTFVATLGQDAGDTLAVRLIVDTAHALGLSVVAEGVETAQQARQVAALGADLAQGWRYGRPLPATESLPARLAPEEGVDPALAAQGVMHGSGELVTVLDEAGRVTYVSSNVLHLLGYVPAQITGRVATELMHPADQHPAEPAAVHVHRLRHANGSYLWFRSRSWRRPAPGPGASRSVVTSEEITTLVETERRLVDREAEFRCAFESAPIAMTVTSSDGTIVRANGAFARLLGVDPAQRLAGTNVADHTHPQDRQLDRTNLEQIRAGSAVSHHVRKRFHRADGTTVTVDVWAASVSTTEGTSIVAYVSPVDAGDARP